MDAHSLHGQMNVYFGNRQITAAPFLSAIINFVLFCDLLKSIHDNRVFDHVSPTVVAYQCEYNSTGRLCYLMSSNSDRNIGSSIKIQCGAGQHTSSYMMTSTSRILLVNLLNRHQVAYKMARFSTEVIVDFLHIGNKHPLILN